ncbi:MAG: YkgJ family cysteine cluster protein [Gammaproteobacteria bacterium]|nr:MAG: YkgJ family cysteine cluster protein [Gammaproteobacteria bacterium]
MELGSIFNFKCHPEIECFNECCKHADITLTPYDILNLSNHLKLSSGDFLKKHTVPFELDQSKMPGVKLKTQDKNPVCLFVDDKKGCSVYENRPTACRYYPLGVMAIKKADYNKDETNYSIIKEPHCMGHKENRKLSVAEYRKEQKTNTYDEYNRQFYQLILKKRSAGASIGRLPEMSLQLFFMACYDLDRFKSFIKSPAFVATYDLKPDYQDLIFKDKTALLNFSFRFLKQVLFGEMTIDLIKGAQEQRLKNRADIIKAKQEAEIYYHRQKEENLKRED